VASGTRRQSVLVEEKEKRVRIQLPLTRAGDTSEPAMLPAAARGAIAAMAMTGMRTFTKEAGWLEEAPPDAVFSQDPTGLLAKIPETKRPIVIELSHWAFGAIGGMAFITMPSSVRKHPWAGALYGLLVWGAFEAAVAPLLRLSQARRLRLLDRAVLAVDHVLYGVIVAGSSGPIGSSLENYS
jgi:hypothetical protein